ncbi:MAG: hypothetical protein QXR53_01745 [Candidatus Norongarragalinales archaeon]
MLEGVREWWENFSYSLEEKGIPPWAIPLALLVLLAIGYLYLFSPGQQAGSVSVKVFSAAGDPISGASVTLQGNGVSETQKTGSSGEAFFEKIPPGEYRGAVYSTDAVFPDAGSFSISVANNELSQKSVYSQAVQTRKVSLSASVDGPEAAKIQLYDDSGNIVGERFGKTAFFSVEPNSQYTLKASADGFEDETVEVSVGQSDSPAKRITLLPTGEEKNGVLYVGVFDTIGVDGNPIQNASVTVFDAATNEKLLSLNTGEAGTTEPQQLALGRQVKIVVEAKGFAREAKTISIAAETEEKFRLAESAEPEGFFLRVVDGNDDAVADAAVQLLSEKTVVGEKTTRADGSADFDGVEKTKSFSAMAFKTGFLPAFKERVSSGEQLALEKADESNSATITVKVVDAAGQGVSEASVILQDDRGRPIGFPARQTGVDGIQGWENVPYKKTVAVASKDGRVGKSKAFTPRQGAEIQITLPKTQGTVLATVSDQFTLQPVPNAVINLVSESGAVAKCSTNSKGECAAKIMEGKTFARITAEGFEEFQSSEFKVPPSTEAKQNFHIISTSAVQAGLYFQGLFDLQGNRVKNLLSPFTTYNAKYSLASGGLEFNYANAHVRIGSQDEPLENLPAVISSYKTVGVVQRGIDYSQASSFLPPLQQQAQNKIIITENAFVPANAIVQAGDTVNWVSQDDNAHSINADDGSFASPQLRRGSTFSRTFNQEGVFYYSDGLKPSTRASVTVVAKKTSSAQQQTQTKGVKWVDYSIPTFKGTKEITIQIKTTASTGSFALEHRSAFNLPGGLLRKPEDPQAGQGKNELLAETQQSGVFEISTQGYCDKTSCVQYWFDNGKQTLEAKYPDEFNLHVKIYSETTQPLTLSGDNAVQVKSLSPVKGEEGEGTVQGNSASITLEQQGGIAEAVAKFQPRKLASDASIKLKAGAIEKTIRLRVVSKEKLSLRETHSPKELVALEQAKLVFSVTDSAGFPVDGATVSFNGIQFSETKEGTYEAAVTPDFVGDGEFQIAKEGFEVLKGTVRVKTPESMVRIQPEAIQAVLSQPSTAVNLKLENLLKNQVTVSSAIVETIEDPQHTAFEIKVQAKAKTQEAEPALKPRESKDFTLNASLKTIPFAARPTRLRESLKGHAVFVFTVGGFSKEQRVPLQIETDYQQKTLDSLWSIETPTVEFVLSPSNPTAEKKVRLSSESPLPLLAGFDLKEPGLFADPASIVIEPNGMGEFTLKKTLLPEQASDCFALSAGGEQKLSIAVSFQGIVSKKDLTLKTTFAQTQNCKPENAVELTLPFSTDLMLAKSVQAKENADGSVAMRVGGETLAFDTGASISEEKDRITIPTGTKFYLAPQRVSKQANTARFSLPVDARMEMPSNAEVKNNNQGGFSVLMPRSIASFPAAVVLGTEGGRTVAVIPKGTTVEFINLAEETKNPNAPGGGDQWIDPRLLNPMPFDPIELSLPVEFLMRFPQGSMVIDPQKTQQQASNIPGAWNYYAQYYPQNVRGVFYPPQNRFAFSSEAQIKQATGGLVEVLVPRDSQFFVPAGVARVDKDIILVTFPVPVELRFPSNSIVVQDANTKRKNTVKAADDVAVQFAFDVQLNAQGGGAKSVIVPPFSTVAFLKGATASVIEDPNTYSKCDFEITTAEEVIVDIPSGAKVFETSKPKIALLPQCTKVTVKTKDREEKELVTTPKVKRIEAGEFRHSGNSLFVPEKTSVKFKVCNPEKSDEESKRASITFAKESALSLPANYRDRVKSGEIAFGGKHKEILVVDEGVKYNVGRTDKLSITPKDKLVIPDKADSDGRILVGVPAQSKLSFIPTCEEASGDFLVRGTIPMSITEETGSAKELDAMTITLNNSLLQGLSGTQSNDFQKIIYVSNPGSTEYAVTAIRADGEAVKAFRKGSFTRTTEQGQQAVIAPFKQGEEQVMLLFYIPEEAIQPSSSGFGSCIKEDKQYVYEGNVVFDMQQKEEQDEKKLKTKVILDAKVVPCTAKAIEEQTKDLNLIVDGTGSSAPGAEGGIDLQGDKLFSFKNAGHKRYYAYSNNLNEPLQLSFPNDGQQISCFYYDNARGASVAGGKILAKGESIFLECEAKHASASDYKIIAKGARTGEERVKTLKVQVFTPPAGSESLYPSTPIGTLWVGATGEKPTPTPSPVAGAQLKKKQVQCDPGFNYAYCQNNFCTYDSAINAICNFMSVASMKFDAETNDTSSVKTVCTNLPWKMSFVLHLSNTRAAADLDDAMKQMAEQIGRQSKFKEFKVSEQAKIDFTGCGAYLVEAHLNPAASGGFCEFDPKKIEGGKKPLQIEFRSQKLMSCEETLANAPLLMPADDLFVYTGNEIIESPVNMRFNGLPDFIEIGKYSEKADANDYKMAGQIVSSMYSLSPQVFDNLNTNGFVDSSKPFFDDGALCEANVQGMKNALAIGWHGGTAAACASAFIPGPQQGFIARLCANLILYNVETLSSCGIVKGVSASNACTGTDFCTHLRFVMYPQAFIDAGFGGPASAAFRQIALRALGSATFTYVSSAITGSVEDPTAVYGGSNIAAVTGGSFGRQTGAFTAVALSPVTGAVIEGYASDYFAAQRLDELVAKSTLTGSESEEMRYLYNEFFRSGRQSHQFNFGEITPDVKNRILSDVERKATARITQEGTALVPYRAIVRRPNMLPVPYQRYLPVPFLPQEIPAAGASSAAGQAATSARASYYSYYRAATNPGGVFSTTKNAYERINNNFFNINYGNQNFGTVHGGQNIGGPTGGGAGAGGAAPATGGTPQQVETGGAPTQPVSTPQVQKPRGIARIGRLLAQYAPTALLSLITNVQSEPVEAPLAERVTNYLVSMHFAENGNPSTVAYCYYDPATKKCDKEKRLCFTQQACEGKEACLYVKKLDIPYSGVVQKGEKIPAYAMFFIDASGGSYDYIELFDSLFAPDVEPTFQGNVEAELTEKEIGAPCDYSQEGDSEETAAGDAREQAQGSVETLAAIANGDASFDAVKNARQTLDEMQSQGLVIVEKTPSGEEILSVQVVEGKEEEAASKAKIALENTANQMRERNA